MKYKCVVCGHTGCRSLTTGDVQCTLCFSISSAEAKKPGVALGNGLTAVTPLPPQEVWDAAKVVSDYFKLHTGKPWAFGDLCSRDSVGVSPTVSFTQLQTIAAAFLHDVVPRPTPDKLRQIARIVADEFSNFEQPEISLPFDMSSTRVRDHWLNLVTRTLTEAGR